MFHAAYIADIVRASVRAVPAAGRAGQALALSRPDILRLVVAPNAARVARYRQSCLALIKNCTLAIAIGYQDLMAVINTAITQTGLALEGISLALAAYLGLALALGGALSAWNARSARHGPGDRTRAPGRTALPPSRAADAGRGDWPGRPVLLAALLAAGSLADWALLNAVWRGDAAACAQAAGACWAAGENLPLLLFGAMQPAHRGPPWSPAPRCCWRSPSRWARAGCPDGHAPASPSPRWRLPPARCPAGPGAARPSARCAGAACWSR